jgi:hypothetical protein
MKFINFFLLLWVIFAPPESGSGFRDPIESRSNPDPDPQNTARKKSVKIHNGETKGSYRRNIALGKD